MSTSRERAIGNKVSSSPIHETNLSVSTLRGSMTVVPTSQTTPRHLLNHRDVRSCSNDFVKERRAV